MIVDPASAPVSGQNGLSTLHLSVAGGLTQFGAYVDTLAPGAFSAHRHWHELEDEFLYVIEGTATVRDTAGDHALHPGDAACWPHGAPNAHHVTNLTDAPCRYLIVGSRVAGDVCHYPDSGARQVNGPSDWRVIDSDGTVLRSGPLPPELLDLPPVWGIAHDPATPAPSIIRRETAPEEHGTPGQIAALGSYHARLYSDAGGLSQFGAFVETLHPGSSSSDRHWHESEDEFLFMLDGEATLIEDEGAHLLGRGDCVCWPAGVANAHHVVNRSDVPCTYLVVGTRAASDRVHYAEIDRIYIRENGVARRTRRDGTPLP